MRSAIQQAPATVRLDKWLWCARFFKTRGLAVEEINRGRVHVNERAAKPGRDLKSGELISFRQGAAARTVLVVSLSNMRGPASVAQGLYVETPESIAARELLAENRRLSPEPAESLRNGRPTKRDRREIERVDAGAIVHDNRWSASLRD
jgi:ribosome-associated heat shock protein Hsp15